MNEHQRQADRCDPSRPDEAAHAMREAGRACDAHARLILAHESAREALVHAQGPAWPERRVNALRTAVLALDRVVGGAS